MSKDKDIDNFNLRQSCFNHVNVDILCVAESKRIGENNVDVNGFKWIGHNRLNRHRNAKMGSGEVGIFIRKTLYDCFKITVLDKAHEGIMWVKFGSKVDEFTFNLCM